MGFVCLAAFDLVENFHLGMETHREILKTKRWRGEVRGWGMWKAL